MLSHAIAVLGITFKPDCPDIRNTRVVNLIQELKEYGCDIDVYDPVADKGAVKTIEKIKFKNFKGVKNLNKYDLIVTQLIILFRILIFLILKENI